MKYKLLLLVVFFIISSCKSDEGPWPKYCNSEIKMSTMFISIDKQDRIKVNGKPYRKGLIKQHADQLKKSCENVRVMLSIPNNYNLENAQRFIELLGESQQVLRKDDYPIVVTHE